MPLEPRLSTLVKVLKFAESEDLQVPMAVRREQAARTVRRFGRPVIRDGPDVARIYERVVPVAGGRIRVRFYQPHNAGPLPLYVFLHGGGWCVGTLEERDPRCRAIAAGAQCLVASVDYRMAPENQFPTAPEDCYAALRWLVEHAGELGADPDRVAVGGESAGANLAAAICLMARDRDGPRICHQWLDVPCTDMTLSQPGYHEVADGYLLDAAVIDDFIEHYLPKSEQARDPYASPQLASDHRELPPAWIMGAEFDHLCGDAKAYAGTLEAAGVPVEHIQLDGHIHASFALTRVLASSREYERRAIAALAHSFTQAAGRAR